MNEPLVSVCLITYNHIRYIRQAIDSVIAQRLNVKWEIIVADDCSTDGTSEILKEYNARHPNLIRLVLQNPNVGPARNFIDLIASARGKYIAYMECDDYWIDDFKLQSQFDFMEANPDYAISFTNAYEILNNELSTRKAMKDLGIPSRTIAQDELLQYNCILSLTSFFINNKLTLPVWWSSNLKLGDWAFHILNSYSGKIYYSNKVTACYRMHFQGAFSMRDPKIKAIDYIESGEIIRKSIKQEYNQVMIKGQASRVKALLRISIDESDRGLYFKNFKKYIHLLTFKDITKYFIKGLLMK